jgi:MFS family permease
MLMAIFTVSIMDRQILAVLFEPIKGEFALSDAQLGLLSGPAFVLFYTTLGVPIALWADRGNRTRIINVSIVVFSVMTVLCGMAASFWQLLLARVGVAIGEAGTNPPSHSIIAELYSPAERTTAMGLFSLGPHVGLLLGLFAGAWLGQLYGWRVALWSAGAAGLLLSIFSARVLRETRPGRREAKNTERAGTFREGCRLIWGNAALRHLIAGGSLLCFVAYGLVTWLPSFLVRSHELSIGQAGTMVAVVFGILGGAGTVLGAMVTNRLARRNVRWKAWAPALGAALMLPYTLGGILAHDPAVALTCLAIAGIGTVWFLGPTFALVQDLVGSRMRALAAALLLFLGNLVGLGLGPQLIGLLSDAFSARFGADALRYALLMVVPIGLWGAYHYLLAARTLAPVSQSCDQPDTASAALLGD